jgi:hypothetical protein
MATEMWLAERGAKSCPTVAQLKADGKLSEKINVVDAWGMPYTILCAGDDVTVVSSGPDRKDQTADDVAVPERSPASK